MKLSCQVLKLNPTRLGAAAIGLCLLWYPPAAPAQERVAPDADTLLKSMSDYMASLGAFSVSYDIDTEVVDQEGQKLSFSSSGQMVVQRPGHLFATREGVVANIEVHFDGETLSLYGKNLNAYFQADAKGTIDDAIDVLRADLGIDAPGADLLASNIYSGQMMDVREGAYIGVARLGGQRAHHLAYRTPQVDWQIWIQADGDPLPIKYVITSKWITGAPHYSIRLSNWNVSPSLAGVTFDFTPPEGARRLEAIEIDAMGEIVVEGE